MSKKSHVASLSLKVLGLAVRIPLYALYGAGRMVVGLVRLPSRVQQTTRVLSGTLPCPACSTETSLSGRWTCGTCAATWVGWVGECPLGHRASFFPCVRCGASIVLYGGHR